MKMSGWSPRWVEMARLVASWSKDPSTKVGAVVVDQTERLLGIGWNGFARGVEDSPERLNDRATKYKFVVHAEMNAILNAGYMGVPIAGSTMYVVGLPCCNECAKAIVQSGVSNVIMVLDKEPENWRQSFEITEQMFNESGVKFTTINAKSIGGGDEPGVGQPHR